MMPPNPPFGGIRRLSPLQVDPRSLSRVGQCQGLSDASLSEEMRRNKRLSEGRRTKLIVLVHLALLGPESRGDRNRGRRKAWRSRTCHAALAHERRGRVRRLWSRRNARISIRPDLGCELGRTLVPRDVLWWRSCPNATRGMRVPPWQLLRTKTGRTRRRRLLGRRWLVRTQDSHEVVVPEIGSGEVRRER